MNKTSDVNVRRVPIDKPEKFREFVELERRFIGQSPLYVSEIDSSTAWLLSGKSAFYEKMGFGQIIQLMFKAGRYKRAGLLGIGVLPEYRRIGVAQALAVALFMRYEKRGLSEAYYYSVNEANTHSRRFAESLGGTGRVLYHCYDKPLSRN